MSLIYVFILSENATVKVPDVLVLVLIVSNIGPDGLLNIVTGVKLTEAELPTGLIAFTYTVYV
jgi:hypothetical protein